MASWGTYVIRGTVKGVENGTWIYLTSMDRFDQTPLLDSARVKKERFEFRGQLRNKVLQAMLGLKGPVYKSDGVTVKEHRLTDAAMLWLENNDFFVEGEKGRLFQATINGPATQQDFQLLMRGNVEKAEFIRQHPNTSYLSVFLLNAEKEQYGKEVTAALYKLLSEDRKETLYGRQVATYLEGD
ncbi:uncharacterized protein DUF4369 [Pontibacter ummariensis]|uniref:DUF4369 domain-containing protein n=1 Tax=Pontibacter ummariensis TaxID=1610492 RepID=A0A239KYQ0_9BACT|nr:DUF4369 domain-containing protein [Pontibacter ummariensis]PRY04936.1 uncharacterized protein DUF4369 [Pontibacter ummariensis]SNT22394.1 protein of unknown function [Pontibacter ummariensis]